MDNFFKIQSQTLSKNQNIFYTTIGQHTDVDSQGFPITYTEEDSCAKLSQNNNRNRYFIKIDTYGKPYNPIGMYSENQINKFSSKAGKKIYTFKETNEKAFNHYINFLKTKNLAWLRNAEREME